MGRERRYVTGSYLPLRDAIDRLMEGSVIAPQTFGGQGGFPPVDVYATENDIVLETAIPGANPDDINVSVTGDTVSISGEVKHRHEGQKGQPLVEEIWRGRFQRSFTLPTQVDPSKAEAGYEHGILTLRLPRSEATRPRKIQVTSQRGSATQGESAEEMMPTEKEQPS